MNLPLNILWCIFGGIGAAASWLLAALFMAISIVGLPWVPAAMRVALYTLWPFGWTVEAVPDASPLSPLGNLVWFALAGWWLALMHLFVAILLACTIIGLPFAWAHLKLAGLSLAPVGTRIVPTDGTGVRIL